MPSTFRWNAAARRFIAPNGHFVSRETVRLALDRALRSSETDAVLLAEELRSGRIGLWQWRVAMRDLIKEVHLYSAAVAKGGRVQLNSSDYGRIGQILAHGRRGSMGQYEYLERWAKEIQAGLPFDGRFIQRAQMYVKAARSTYHNVDSLIHEMQGYDEERSIRHISDSCPGCIDAERMGWVLIGTLPPIGSRDCLSNCRCTISYRKSDGRQNAA